MPQCCKKNTVEAQRKQRRRAPAPPEKTQRRRDAEGEERVHHPVIPTSEARRDLPQPWKIPRRAHARLRDDRLHGALLQLCASVPLRLCVERAGGWLCASASPPPSSWWRLGLAALSLDLVGFSLVLLLFSM
jgi:hypothetical protein